MSVNINGISPTKTILQISLSERGEDGQLQLVIQDYYTSAVIVLETKDLVMAIKQVEEEREAYAKGFSPGHDSTEARSREHGTSLDRAIYHAEMEYREMLRVSGLLAIHDPYIAHEIWILRKARSISEVEYIFNRFKEAHARRTSPKARRLEIDDMETEAASYKWRRSWDDLEKF